jgi:hypothetical protein
VIKYLPAICFALIPFGVWGQNIFYGHANTLLLSATLILFLSECNDLKVSSWLKVAGVYLGCWMAYIFAMTMIGNLPQELAPNMIFSVMFIWAGMLFFLSVYRGSLSLGSWSNIICFIATAQACLAISQVYGYDPIRILLEEVVDVHGQMDFTTPVGTMGNQNFLAAFLAISLPFFFRKRRLRLLWKQHEIAVMPWGWFMVLPILIYALILTRTTTAIGAAIIGSLFFFFGWKWALFGVLPASILYAIKYWNIGIFNNARTEYWMDAWQSTSHSWQTFLFGWGPGVTWKSGNMLHSEYVNTFFNFGLIGIVLMMGYIFRVHKMNKMLLSAFIVLCIDMIGNHALHITPTAVLIITIMALMEREKTRGNI